VHTRDEEDRKWFAAVTGPLRERHSEMETRHGGAIKIENPPVKMTQVRVTIPADLRRKLKIYRLQNEMENDSEAVTAILKQHFEGEKS